MKSMKKELALVASGVLLGAALAAPAATAALTAQLSNQKFVVDGKPAQIEAYSIGGSNYVKLRDVGRAANFSVSMNAKTNLIISAIAALAIGVFTALTVFKNYQKLEGTVAAALIAAVITFALCFAVLTATMKVTEKRKEQLEEEPTDADKL